MIDDRDREVAFLVSEAYTSWREEQAFKILAAYRQESEVEKDKEIERHKGDAEYCRQGLRDCQVKMDRQSKEISELRGALKALADVVTESVGLWDVDDVSLLTVRDVALKDARAALSPAREEVEG